MKRPEDPQLGPADEGDLYQFLLRTTQEWQFFCHANALGLREATGSTLKGAAIARDCAVDQWNEWMNKKVGKDWFLVFQRHTMGEDYRNESKAVYLTAGSNVLAVHRCESIYALVRHSPWTVFAPDGTEVLVREAEHVDLHCIMSPPQDDTLRVLPVNAVPSISLFGH